MIEETADIAIIGAGAAGLMAGIWAGRTARHQRIVILEGAPKLGAKILVAGGGRCNVTHQQVTARDYAGSSPAAIEKVLRRFPVAQTIQFFEQLGVPLKQESTGKLFPVTNNSRTVLQALLQGVQAAQVRIHYPRRVQTITRLVAPDNNKLATSDHSAEGFQVAGDWGQLRARQVILATGGKSLPRSGSDGQGYQFAVALGHQLTPHIFPALVPLLLPPQHFLATLSGLSLPVTLSVCQPSGKQLISFTNSLLCTHFGLSGPVVLDISRYYLNAQFHEPQIQLRANWLPTLEAKMLDQMLQKSGNKTLASYLTSHLPLPERFARAIIVHSQLDPLMVGHQLTRLQRQTLVANLTAMNLPISGHRGYSFAEVTAGGVPLSEIYLDRMASRRCPGLYLCGEICDVDGRIGGFNFQWAWASGYLAGQAAAQ
jgi:predicted Rossmann fold flavoprotein